MKNIIFIAPPAGGKGTASAAASELYNIPAISTGDIFRAKAVEDSDEGREINRLISNGMFIDDETTINILLERISQDDCQEGYILDGFPRTFEQAKKYDEIMEKEGKNISAVIVLDVSKEELLERSTGRESCPVCKKIYNFKQAYQAPKVEQTCDVCNVRLDRRADDNEETFNTRYETYLNKTEPLIEYYKNKGIVHYVDANGKKDNTFRQVKEIIEELND